GPQCERPERVRPVVVELLGELAGHGAVLDLHPDLSRHDLDRHAHPAVHYLSALEFHGPRRRDIAARADGIGWRASERERVLGDRINRYSRGGPGRDELVERV